MPVIRYFVAMFLSLLLFPVLLLALDAPLEQVMGQGLRVVLWSTLLFWAFGIVVSAIPFAIMRPALTLSGGTGILVCMMAGAIIAVGGLFTWDALAEPADAQFQAAMGVSKSVAGLIVLGILLVSLRMILLRVAALPGLVGIGGALLVFAIVAASAIMFVGPQPRPSRADPSEVLMIFSAMGAAGGLIYRSLAWFQVSEGFRQAALGKPFREVPEVAE